MGRRHGKSLLGAMLAGAVSLGFSVAVAQQVSPDAQAGAAVCRASAPEAEAALLFRPLQSYESPLSAVPEEEDAPIDPQLKAEIMARDRFYEAQHYAAQIADQPTLYITHQRYMNLTRESPQALRIYETRLVILFPNCQPVLLQNGALSGDITMPFDALLKTMAQAQSERHQQVIDYLTTHVTPLPETLGAVLDMAGRDHNVDRAVVRGFLPDDMVSHFFGETIPARKLGEAQVLAFLFRGGKILDTDRHVIVILPKNSAGISELFNAMTLTADGQFRRYIDLDPALLGRILGQWQVELNHLILSEVHVPSRPSCQIDLAGKWQQGTGNDAVAFCPFYALAEQMVREVSYRQSRDYKSQKSVFTRAAEMLKP